MNQDYILKWLINDITVYLPPLIIFGIFGFFLKKYIPPRLSAPKAAKQTCLWKNWLCLPFFLAMYSLCYTASFVNYAIAGIFAGELRDVFESIMPANGNQWLIMLLFAGIISPFIEEIIYRHILLKPLRRFGDWKAVIITAVLFGVLHGNLTQFLYAVVGGLILGIVAVRANSVKPAIAVHMLSNSFDIGKAYLYETTDNKEKMSSLFLLLILGGLLVAVVLGVKGQFSLNKTTASSD